MILRAGLSAYSATPTLQQVLRDQMWCGLGPDLCIPSIQQIFSPLYPVPGIGYSAENKDD